MINTVFLDMDGVLVNFRKSVYDAFNKSWPEHSETAKKWAFWDDWNDVTLEMINIACDKSFWEHLEWTEDGKDILLAIWETFNPEDIYLLTDPVIGNETISGKMLWVDAWLPEYVKRTIITQAPKYLLARPDALLIDDKDENVDGFREAGGKALLVPRPWNRAHLQANQTVEVVKEFLERMT